MKILFDNQAFSMQRHGGVSRCFAELYSLINADKSLGCDVEIALNETENAYMRDIGVGKPLGWEYAHFPTEAHWPMKGRAFALRNRLFHGVPYDKTNRLYFDYKNRYNMYESICRLKKGNFDIFHPTFFDDYFLPYLKGKPFVLTIHDMMPELYPQYFDQEKDMQVLSKRILGPKAAAIIAVSEKTKEDAIRILGLPEEKVHVVYHGCSFVKVADGADAVESAPYILYVGDRAAYKNFMCFVRDVAVVLKRHPEFLVKCTGKPFNKEEISIMTRYGVKERFVQHWVKDDAEFYRLYHNAFCFVYPSEYEGFGIPILEAYTADCPVMLNNASCFPEIAGDAAIFFTMKEDETNFVEQFETLYSYTSEERETLLAKQRKRLELYSWQKSAEQLVNIYRSILCNSQ